MQEIKALNSSEMYSVIRFIALEYAAKNGPYSKMYLYMDHKGNPILISTIKIYIFKDTVSIYYMPVKHLILFCLYMQFNIEQHLGILLRITRILERQTELSYAKTLGIDVSTYRLLESQLLTNKGLITVNHGKRIYQFTPDNILEKLDIPQLELNISLEVYRE